MQLLSSHSRESLAQGSTAVRADYRSLMQLVQGASSKHDGHTKKSIATGSSLIASSSIME
eukprot:5773005-Amphidinium_carterae.1